MGFLPLPEIEFRVGAEIHLARCSRWHPDFRPSYAQQFNLTLEHEIAPWSLMIRAAAVGNLGRHLYNTWNANQPIPGAGGDQHAASVLHSRSGSVRRKLFRLRWLSNYYAGQLTIDKRFSKGLSALVGYTWSHAIDNVVLEFGGGAAGPQPQDPRNLRAERGNSIIDLRHRLTASYLWELPFGKGKAIPESRWNAQSGSRRMADQWHSDDSDRPAVLAGTANVDHERTGSRPDVIGTGDLSQRPCSAGSIRALTQLRPRTPTVTRPATACSDPAGPTGTYRCSRIS